MAAPVGLPEKGGSAAPGVSSLRRWSCRLGGGASSGPGRVLEAVGGGLLEALRLEAAREPLAGRRDRQPGSVALPPPVELSAIVGVAGL